MASGLNPVDPPADTTGMAKRAKVSRRVGAGTVMKPTFIGAGALMLVQTVLNALG